MVGLSQGQALALNPFTLLDLPRDADEEMIRRRYRLLARRWHPDRNPDNVLEAERRFKEIAEAYRVLCDPRQRRIWAAQHKVERKTISYWDRQRADVWSLTSQCRVVLYDLARGQANQGWELWKKTCERFGSFDLSQHLSGRDLLDCLFLLAEEHESRGYREEAFCFYEKVYWLQRRRPVMDYFRDETRVRLVSLGEAMLVHCQDAKSLKVAVRCLGFALARGERPRLLAALSDKAFDLGDLVLAQKAERALLRRHKAVKGLKLARARKGVL
ncbi:MAG: J domain-containing protein [Planctomycetota bacterium]